MYDIFLVLLRLYIWCLLPPRTLYCLGYIYGVYYPPELYTVWVVYMVFTTPQNSIPGSAVCKFTVSGITDAFMGDFKVQVGHNVPTIASRVIRHFFKKRKMKGGISLRRKIIAFFATSICCVYKEKIVKNDSHRIT